jgi:predicted nucleic acid-binding protein
MAEQWVLNASPVISLSRVNHAHLLIDLADEVAIPIEVVQELEVGPTDDSARQFLLLGRVSIVETPAPPSDLVAWDLGSGETAVLSFALANAAWTAILDDRAARRCALSFSVPVKGTLGIVILARQRGLISSASDVLRRLRSHDFRLDDSVLAQVLPATVGETWP